MSGFAELVASRQSWIADVLKPWCQRATWKELIQAHQDWPNLAGAVDPQSTLWMWAWSRFPGLVEEGLPGIDETHRIRVRLQNGTEVEGYPEGRESRLGKLRLLCQAAEDNRQFLSEPISIDEIISIERIDVSKSLQLD